MAINFPGSPTNGETFTDGDKTWVYSSTVGAWRLQTQTITGPTGPIGPTGPTGATGATGAEGPRGQAATINVGSVTTGASGSSAEVTNAGNTTDAVFNFVLPRGDAGTITVGTVTTGAAGTAASVTNSGTATQSILDFVIPQGPQGVAGAGTGDVVAANANTFTTNQVITGSTTAALLRITQTGAGHALVVEDSANPDSTPFIVNADGNVGIGFNPGAGINLMVQKPFVQSSAGVGYGIYSSQTIQSDVTGTAYINLSQVNTAAQSFTLNQLYNFFVWGVTTPGAGSTIGNQTGFFVNSSLTGATTNIAFRGSVPSGTGRWNIFMDGTANNYLAGRLGVGAQLTTGAMAQVVNTTAADKAFVVRGAASQTGTLLEVQNSASGQLFEVSSAGAVGIGSTSLPEVGLRVVKTITGATTAYGVVHFGTVQSDVTTRADAFTSGIQTAAASFTLTTLNHFIVGGISTPGAGSTITNQYGFTVTSQLTGATNNYAFNSNLAAGTNRWNLYMGGTAANHLAGNLCIGTTAIATSADKAIHMGNGTAPSANIASGGILYVESGALKYRGSSGTITTLGAA